MKFKRIFVLLLFSLFSFSCATYTYQDEGGIVGTGKDGDCVNEDNESNKCKDN